MLEQQAKQIAGQVRSAMAAGQTLAIQGAGSKSFYGHAISTDSSLALQPYRGIISYEPSELVITVAAGTPISEVESALHEQKQHLPFEPPVFNASATIGGMIAAGLSGPARPWAGPVRDYVLGIRCINGRGEILRFGGQVIKNVAGYDISRLLTGSLGTLAVILDVSIKVLPKPEKELSLVADMDQQSAEQFLREWSAKSIPLSGVSYYQQQLRLRLSGYAAAVSETAKKMGLGQENNLDYWQALRHQTHEFFNQQKPLWRISIPPMLRSFAFADDDLIDWAGGLHWVTTSIAADELRKQVSDLGGHACLYYANDDATPRFHPLSAVNLQLHQRIKQALDPAGIFNPKKMYREL